MLKADEPLDVLRQQLRGDVHVDAGAGKPPHGARHRSPDVVTHAEKLECAGHGGQRGKDVHRQPRRARRQAATSAASSGP